MVEKVHVLQLWAMAAASSCRSLQGYMVRVAPLAPI